MMLLNVLVLGLWLPLAARFGIADHRYGMYSYPDNYIVRSGIMQWTDGILVVTVRLVAYALVPAFVVSSILTVFVIRFPGVLRKYAAVPLSMLGLALFEAIVSRASSSSSALYAAEFYDNF